MDEFGEEAPPFTLAEFLRHWPKVREIAREAEAYLTGRATPQHR